MIKHNGLMTISGVYFEEKPSRDLFFMNVGFDGMVISSKSIGTNLREGNINNALFSNAQNSIIAFGHTTDQNDSPVIDDPIYFSLDQNLNLQNKLSWGSKNIDEQFSSIIQTSDGGYLGFGSYGWSPKGGIVVKFDNTLNVQWTKAYATNDVYVVFGSGIELADGSFIVSGVHQEDENNSYLLILNLTAEGNVISQNQYDFDDSFFLIGSDKLYKNNNQIELFCNTTNDLGIANPVKILMDESGSILDSKKLQSQSNFRIGKLKQLSTGEYLFSGSFEINGTTKQVLIDYRNNSVNQIHSFTETDYKASIADFVAQCDANNCLFYIGINLSDSEDQTHFKILESELNCPNESTSLIEQMEINYQSIPFTGLSNYTLGLIQNQSAEDNLDFEIQEIDRTLQIDLGGDTIICPGMGIEISSFNENANFYHWSSGETTPTITVSTPGTYTVSISDNCDRLFVDEIIVEEYPFEPLEFYAPNSFSPNGDGINDCFKCFASKEEILTFNLSIYDRWGNLVFDSTDLDNCWDGRYKGQKVSADVYVFQYQITYPDCSGNTSKLQGGGDIFVH